MDLVRLKYKSISEIVGSDDLGILCLMNESETLLLSIVCDRSTIEQFRMHTLDLNIKDKLLPEVLWKVISQVSDAHYNILINDLDDGQYKSFICNESTKEQFPIRVSDAILLAVIAKLPIYIDALLMDKQSVPCDRVNGNRMSIPVNVISQDMLQVALDKAIKNEDYEQASKLRDEISKRSKAKDR